MEAPTPIQLQERWYLQGWEECWDCGKIFSYTLPKNFYPLWSPLCSQCSPATAFDYVEFIGEVD